jgi:hypothetical protein
LVFVVIGGAEQHLGTCSIHIGLEFPSEVRL